MENIKIQTVARIASIINSVNILELKVELSSYNG